jgi:hypothetical protein
VTIRDQSGDQEPTDRAGPTRDEHSHAELLA